MARSFTYSTREMEKMLQGNGYKYIRTNGSHRIFSNGRNTAVLNKKVNKMVALRIIKECKLDTSKM